MIDNFVCRTFKSLVLHVGLISLTWDTHSECDILVLGIRYANECRIYLLYENRGNNSFKFMVGY